MFINQIDELFDITLNNFFEFLYKKDTFNKFNKDSNFVIYQKDILVLIDEFIKKIPHNKILKAVKYENNIDYIINIIKRYCAFYIYLGIGYYYNESRDLFVTNIIESSKVQKNNIYQIQNFFNSNNNSKIINFFTDIKNIKMLCDFKTMDKIKIIINNNPLKFNNINNLFLELSEEYVINNFLIKDNFHNILKTIIFKEIYLKEEKIEINQLLNDIEKEKGEYKYIEIIVSNKNKIVDFNVIQKFLTIKELKLGLDETIYNYIFEMQEIKDITIKKNKDFINFLFENKIIIPITEEFLRYHKDFKKYEVENDDKKDDSKINYVINKLSNVINYYSPIVEKNIKLKQEINKYFYKNLDPRMVILFNDNEEIKIIQKLLISDNSSDNDLLIELNNFRKYSYINFKYSNNDFIRLRTRNTIDAIRLINLKKKNEYIETRIGHSNIDLKVVGIAFNSSRLNMNKSKKTPTPLECFFVKDLINVTDITKKKNGFMSFIKVFEKVITVENSKLYYWIFNNKTDIPKLDKHVDYDENNIENNFKIMLAEIYNIWLNTIKNKFLNYTNKLEKINIWNLDYLFNVYKKKYFNFDLHPDIKNQIINEVLLKKFIELPITEDDTDNIIPGMRNKIIELPRINIIKNKKSIIILNDNKKIIEDNIKENSNAICNHYIKWDNLSKLSKTTKQDLNQLVFEFVKKYVMENEKGQRICKSCNELLLLDKYIYEGTYIKEIDQFMTTSMIIHEKLTDLPQYLNLKKTINTLGKNLEKIAYICDLFYYLGNDLVFKLHRKIVIKDTIDLILLHSEYLKNQSKTRSENIYDNYGIKKEYSNLFFFELKDEIFLTSSTDTDYYKLIKYNNVMIYLIFIIIIELNSGQILNLKNDKRCNYFFYSKFGEILFKDLYLRINENEKILLTNIPLFSYIIYYFSCILTNNRLWLWSEKTESFNISIQKSIIHTMIDLINSIIEANLEKNKNYFYEIIYTRFNIKLKNTFNDIQLMKKIDDSINKKIIISNTNKISFISKKIDLISIDNNINFDINFDNKYCEVLTQKIKKNKYKSNNNNINLLTNCEDGNFHQWIIKDNNMFCKLCNKVYYDILKENTYNKKIYDNVKISILKKLTQKYCLNGELHQIGNDGICNLCKINPNTNKYSEKELKNLDLILEKNKNEKINNNFKNIKLENEKLILLNEKNNNIYNNFKKEFEINIINKNNFQNYIDNFIDRLINILGNKIKIKNRTTYLKNTLYIIDHDYLGNLLKEPIHILSSDNLINPIINHPIFKKDILYYKNNVNKMYVYYDIVTLQYIGYSENNKNINQTKQNASLSIEYSIKDLLLLFGLENTYTNLYHLDVNLIRNFNPNLNLIINNLMRNRIINLKQIIIRTKSIIYSIHNNNKIFNIYNEKEKEIVNDFTTKLKKFNLRDKNNSNSVFKNSKNICNLVNFNKINENIDIELNSNYINNNFLNNLYNIDIELIYYIIMNFNKLLDYNKQPAIESELAHLIIKIIEYDIFLYFKENNYYTRKFEYLILGDLPYIDETVKPIGLYQELLTSQEIDDEKIKEENYDAYEENNALDIDDCEMNDDVDDSAELFDSYQQD